MGGGISKMAKQELLATIRDRYRASSKREKNRILDEFIAVCSASTTFAGSVNYSCRFTSRS